MTEVLPLPSPERPSLSPLAAVRDVTRALLRGEEPEQVLLLVAAYARDLGHGDLATINVVDERHEMVRVRIAVGIGSGRMLGTRFPLDRSIAGHVLRSGASEIVADARHDERAFVPAVDRGGFGPAMFVPLSCREGPCGVLVVANRRGGRMFDASDLEVVETFAAQASLVLETVRAEEQLESLLVTADRERVGRTLHDTVIQRLFATGMTLEAARQSEMPAVAQERVSRALESLDETIREIRSTVFE